MIPVLLLLLLLLSITANTEASRSCQAVETCLAALDASKECPLLPVPDRSPSISLGPEGFNITELRKGVYWYSDNAYNTLILYKAGRLALVDFPESNASVTPNGTYLLTTATLQVLKGEIPRRIDMIYGHRHTDHIGRAGTYKKFVDDTFPVSKLFIWGTKETKKFLLRIPNNDVPLPNVIVGKSGRIVSIAPGLDLKLSIIGGHTNSDLIAYILPSADGPGVVHYVDVLWPGGAPFLNFALTIDLGRYITAQRELLRLKFKFFSGGHGPIGSKRDIRTNIAYTKFVIQAARDAMRNLDPRITDGIFARVGDPNDPAFGNTQWVFLESFGVQSQICQRKVIERWGCELYGVDITSRSHCTSALLFNLIDQ